jgi:hypothetical protein
MFGSKRRQTRELAEEITRPIGGARQLTDASKASLERQLRSVVDRGKADELYHRQTGWSKGER